MSTYSNECTVQQQMVTLKFKAGAVEQLASTCAYSRKQAIVE